jgi:hypothetical protein
MPKFDIWSTENKKVTAIKVSVEKESVPVDNSTYVATINSSTKAIAKKQAESNLKSGLLKLKSEINVSKSEKSNKGYDINYNIPKIDKPKPTEIKKAIFCDFNGVLDVWGKVSNESFLSFRLPELACPHKIYKLTKLALSHNADLVFTSLHRRGCNLGSIIARSLTKSGIPEYVDFYNENIDEIEDLTRWYATKELGKRTKEVENFIDKYLYTHYVVFEDDHFIDEKLNPIMTNPMEGLMDEHIDKADTILSKEYKF